MDLLFSECENYCNCDDCPNEFCAYSVCDSRCEKCHPRNHCPFCSDDCLFCRYQGNCLHELERIEEGEFDDDDYDDDDFNYDDDDDDFCD